jgi:hypothetical protein
MIMERSDGKKTNLKKRSCKRKTIVLIYLPIQSRPILDAPKQTPQMHEIKSIRCISPLQLRIIKLEFTIWWHKCRLYRRYIRANDLSRGELIGEVSISRRLIKNSM